jgi:restriction system protein
LKSWPFHSVEQPWGFPRSGSGATASHLARPGSRQPGIWMSNVCDANMELWLVIRLVEGRLGRVPNSCNGSAPCSMHCGRSALPAPDEVVERVAKDQKVTDAQLNEVMASGDLRFRNQVQWARLFLAQEGLIDRSQRGIWSLTEQGRKKYLTPDQARDLFRKWTRIFQDRRRGRSEPSEEPAEITPPEADEPTDYKTQLLAIIRTLSNSGFERLSQRVLREAGFSSVEVTGRSGDGGIDGSGTLQLNSLVSIKVLFQCKRYRDSVSPSQIRDFRGAMQGRADKGIVITTGTFTSEARREASTAFQQSN